VSLRRRLTIAFTAMSLAVLILAGLFLVVLARSSARDNAREELRETASALADVWDDHWWGPTKTLDVHIAALRRKLAGLDLITTLRNVGYRLDPPG
jgi:DNA-binding response OmpR family regulator